MRRRYLTENPAIGLGKIKVVQVPTDYFPPDEFERIMAATYIRRGERGGGDVKANQARLRTMTLLMRWSGLRIRDAVTLERHRLHGDSLLLYQAKTGTPYVLLPPHVVELLQDVPPGPKPNRRYFFWSGNGDPKSAVADWQRSYRRLFKSADIRTADGEPKRCHPHMFQDTFAVEMLFCRRTYRSGLAVARPCIGEDYREELLSLREGTGGSIAGKRRQCMEGWVWKWAAEHAAAYSLDEQAYRMAGNSIRQESQG